jgi:hypothetical protein
VEGREKLGATFLLPTAVWIKAIARTSSAFTIVTPLSYCVGHGRSALYAAICNAQLCSADLRGVHAPMGCARLTPARRVVVIEGHLHR